MCRNRKPEKPWLLVLYPRWKPLLLVSKTSPTRSLSLSLVSIRRQQEEKEEELQWNNGI